MIEFHAHRFAISDAGLGDSGAPAGTGAGRPCLLELLLRAGDRIASFENGDSIFVLLCDACSAVAANLLLHRGDRNESYARRSQPFSMSPL